MVLCNVDSVKEAAQHAAETLMNSMDINGSRTYRETHTQEQLATQYPLHSPSPARPSSRESIRSQNGDTGTSHGPIIESQEGRAIESDFRNSRNRMSIASIIEPIVPNKVHNSRVLLQHLLNGRQQVFPPKRQSPQLVNEISYRSTKDNFASDTGIIREYDEGKIPDHVRTSQSCDVAPSQDQGSATSFPAPQRQSPLVADASSQQRMTPTNSQPHDEVTSFQKQLTSTNTSPISPEWASVPADPVKNSAETTTSRSDESGRRVKNFEHGPWANMTKLGRKDVVIARDQEELLQRPDCWIPADVGQPIPQGHVPSALLKEWNAKMSRLFRDKRAVSVSQEVDSALEQEEGDPSPSQPGIPLDNESDSESEYAPSWSQSPSHHLRRPLAPPDSSPIRQHDSTRTRAMTEKNVEGTTNVVNNINNHDRADVQLSASQISHRVDAVTIPGAKGCINDAQDQNIVQSSASHHTVDAALNDFRPEVEMTEFTDESDMETSIPQALNVFSQDIASQLGSSGLRAPDSSSMNSSTVARVQILDTPAAALKRGAGDKSEQTRNDPNTWIAQQSSSNSNKSSSQVIANSIDSNGNISIQVAQQRPLVADSQHINNEEAQDSSLPSHQDSQRILEVIPESSIRSEGLHTQPDLHNDEAQIRSSGSNQNSYTPSVYEARPKRKVRDTQVDDESPSKRPKKTTNGDIIKDDTEIIHQVEHTYFPKARGKGREFDEESYRVFDLFTKSYPRFAGNFDHFYHTCCQIQALHSRGNLPYYLWDAFVVSYWVHYRDYLSRCIAAGKDYLNYEEFFHEEITKPAYYRRFSKRNLNPRTIRVVTAGHESSTELSSNVDKGTQTIQTDLVDSSTTYQTPSFANKGNELISQTLSDVILTVDKPTQANIGVKLSVPSTVINNRPIMVDSGIQVNLSTPPPPLRRTDGLPVISEDQERNIAESQTSAVVIDDSSSDSIGENEPEMVTDYHETASQELGVPTPEEQARKDNSDNESVQQNYGKSLELISRMRRENFQAVQSLLNTPLPEPAKDPYRHDRNTHFKNWARDDQNFSKDRRRRGGKDVPCDEYGHVLFTEYSRVDAENAIPFRNWTWRPSRNS